MMLPAHSLLVSEGRDVVLCMRRGGFGVMSCLDAGFYELLGVLPEWREEAWSCRLAEAEAEFERRAGNVAGGQQ